MADWLGKRTAPNGEVVGLNQVWPESVEMAGCPPEFTAQIIRPSADIRIVPKGIGPEVCCHVNAKPETTVTNSVAARITSMDFIFIIWITLLFLTLRAF